MISHRVELDVAAVAPAGVRTVVADIFMPEAEPGGPCVLACCLPGGGMSRRYYDMPGADGGGSFSMARHLVAAGFAVALIDHPGVGESDRPDDGYTLTPHLVAAIDAHGVDQICKGLASGTLVPGVAPIDVSCLVGIGHSAGACVTVHMQGRHRNYDAIALLGFGGQGMPAELLDAERAVAGDPVAIHRCIAELARQRFGEPLPMFRPRRGRARVVEAPPEPEARAALAASRTNLLAVVGLSSMIPGSLLPDIGTIDVPVFVGVGERDITGPPQRIPSAFTASGAVTLFVLPDAGHNHNVHRDRAVLWDRIVTWLRTVVAP